MPAAANITLKPAFIHSCSASSPNLRGHGQYVSPILFFRHFHFFTQRTATVSSVGRNLWFVARTVARNRADATTGVYHQGVSGRQPARIGCSVHSSLTVLQPRVSVATRLCVASFLVVSARRRLELQGLRDDFRQRSIIRIRAESG